MSFFGVTFDKDPTTSLYLILSLPVCGVPRKNNLVVQFWMLWKVNSLWEDRRTYAVSSCSRSRLDWHRGKRLSSALQSTLQANGPPMWWVFPASRVIRFRPYQRATRRFAYNSALPRVYQARRQGPCDINEIRCTLVTRISLVLKQHDASIW